MKVKSIEYAGKADVYNMEVEDTHNFVVNGGAVVHNCYDEWRYVCMARPIAPRKSHVEKRIDLANTEDPLNMIRDSYEPKVVKSYDKVFL